MDAAGAYRGAVGAFGKREYCFATIKAVVQIKKHCGVTVWLDNFDTPFFRHAKPRRALASSPPVKVVLVLFVPLDAMATSVERGVRQQKARGRSPSLPLRRPNPPL